MDFPYFKFEFEFWVLITYQIGISCPIKYLVFPIAILQINVFILEKRKQNI